ncbi:MAG: hypothetical protein AAB840_02080 [Patescibacteria group bacterium]
MSDINWPKIRLAGHTIARAQTHFIEMRSTMVIEILFTLGEYFESILQSLEKLIIPVYLAQIGCGDTGIRKIEAYKICDKLYYYPGLPTVHPKCFCYLPEKNRDGTGINKVKVFNFEPVGYKNPSVIATQRILNIIWHLEPEQDRVIINWK